MSKRLFDNIRCELECYLDKRDAAAAAAGLGDQIFAQQVWIDQNGDDSTAELGNPDRPFKTGAAAAALADFSVPVAFHFGAGGFTFDFTPGGEVVGIFGVGRGITGVTLSATSGPVEIVSDKSASLGITVEDIPFTIYNAYILSLAGGSGTVLQTLQDCHVEEITGSLSLSATDTTFGTVTVTTGSALTLVNVRGTAFSWTSTPALTMAITEAIFTTSFTVVATAAGLTGNAALIKGLTTPVAVFTIDANDVIKLVVPNITTTFQVTTTSSQVNTFSGSVIAKSGTGSSTGTSTAAFS